MIDKCTKRSNSCLKRYTNTRCNAEICSYSRKSYIARVLSQGVAVGVKTAETCQIPPSLKLNRHKKKFVINEGEQRSEEKHLKIESW